MSCLHIVNKSPFDHQALQQCLSAIDSSDAVILIEDAVYAASISYFDNTHTNFNFTENIFVLESDLDARGINQVSQKIEKIDYAGFVKLVAEYQNSLSWF